MKTLLIGLALVCAPLSGMAGDAPNSTDEENIQGIWSGYSESQNGREWSVDYQYVFRGDKLTFRDETGKEMKYSFKLEAAGNLKFITVLPAEAPADAKPVSVAYELNGDSLKIVVAPAGSRPTEFSDKNDQELIICKRKSP